MNYILRILQSARELRRYYLAVSFLSVLVSLTSILLPLFTGWAIDEIGHGTAANVSRVAWLAFGIFMLDFLANLLNNINGYLGDQLSVRLQRTLSRRYFEHLLALPQAYFDKELSGKIINRLNRSIRQITDFMQVFSNNFLQFVISTIFALVAVAFYSWQVAIMLASLYPIYIFMTVKTSNRWLKYQEKINLYTDIASGRFAEAINQLRVVKSFLRERQELSFFNRHLSKVVATNRPQSKYWHIRDFQRRLVLNVIFLGVYLYVFVAAADGTLTPGQAVALILFAQQIRIPLFTISFLVENTQRAVADSKDYFEVMSLQPAITDQPNAKTLDKKQVRGELMFSDVRFGYDEHTPVLRSLTFKVKPGTKTALVGESGEGKTTISSLLLRLYDVQSGTISIDDQDIATVSQSSLRDQIAVVFQEPALFSGTVRENIAYARPKATMAEVEAAAKAANAHGFVEKFEKGYDTEIGERGLKLSGGQKQRIAIARALLKDAPILILDEATSSLDSRSEQAVQEALDRLMRGRTTLIIAHRLSTIQAVDQIVTLRNGRVDESGSPAELALSGGIYSQLLALQQTTGEKSKKQLRKFEIVN